MFGKFEGYVEGSASGTSGTDEELIAKFEGLLTKLQSAHPNPSTQKKAEVPAGPKVDYVAVFKDRVYKNHAALDEATKVYGNERLSQGVELWKGMLNGQIAVFQTMDAASKPLNFQFMTGPLLVTKKAIVKLGTGAACKPCGNHLRVIEDCVNLFSWYSIPCEATTTDYGMTLGDFFGAIDIRGMKMEAANDVAWYKAFRAC